MITRPDCMCTEVCTCRIKCIPAWKKIKHWKTDETQWQTARTPEGDIYRAGIHGCGPTPPPPHGYGPSMTWGEVRRHLCLTSCTSIPAMQHDEIVGSGGGGRGLRHWEVIKQRVRFAFIPLYPPPPSPRQDRAWSSVYSRCVSGFMPVCVCVRVRIFSAELCFAEDPEDGVVSAPSPPPSPLCAFKWVQEFPACCHNEGGGGLGVISIGGLPHPDGAHCEELLYHMGPDHSNHRKRQGDGMSHYRITRVGIGWSCCRVATIVAS
jgi:hypothetical protein